MCEFNLTLAMPHGRAMEKGCDVPLPAHLAIVSDVDVPAMYKNRVAVSISDYHILGVCKPRLAQGLIAPEAKAGTLPRCIFRLRADRADSTPGSGADPVPVPGLSHTDKPHASAHEAPARGRQNR